MQLRVFLSRPSLDAFQFEGQHGWQKREPLQKARISALADQGCEHLYNTSAEKSQFFAPGLKCALPPENLTCSHRQSIMMSRS